MFGKRLSQYLGFQKVWLALIAATALASGIAPGAAFS